MSLNPHADYKNRLIDEAAYRKRIRELGKQLTVGSFIFFTLMILVISPFGILARWNNLTGMGIAFISGISLSFGVVMAVFLHFFVYKGLLVYDCERNIEEKGS